MAARHARDRPWYLRVWLPLVVGRPILSTNLGGTSSEQALQSVAGHQLEWGDSQNVPSGLQIWSPNFV